MPRSLNTQYWNLRHSEKESYSCIGTKPVFIRHKTTSDPATDHQRNKKEDQSWNENVPWLQGMWLQQIFDEQSRARTSRLSPKTVSPNWGKLKLITFQEMFPEMSFQITPKTGHNFDFGIQAPQEEEKLEQRLLFYDPAAGTPVWWGSKAIGCARLAWLPKLRLKRN